MVIGRAHLFAPAFIEIQGETADNLDVLFGAQNMSSVRKAECLARKLSFITH